MVNSHTHPTRLSVRIKASKTDSFWLGVSLVLGATHRDLGCLAAILPCVALRDREATAGPLFQLASGAFLTHERLVTEVRCLLLLAGLDPELYSSHSFWIGAAMSATQAGLEGPYHSNIRMMAKLSMEVSETLSNGRSKELINRTFRPRRPSSAAKTE